jgi:hypothetical protein
MKDRFICDSCGQRFLIKYYLIRHIRVRHLKNFVEKKTPDQPTPCEVCGKILKNRGLLKPHMRSHKVMTAADYCKYEPVFYDLTFHFGIFHRVLRFMSSKVQD